MSFLGTLPENIATIIEASGFVSGVPVIVRRRGDTLNDLDAKLAAMALCIYVMPVLPKVPVRGSGDFVFFQAAEVRVRVIENRKLNSTGLDAYEIAEGVCLALQGTNPGEALAARLEISDTDLIEDANGLALDIIAIAAFAIES